VLGMDDPDKCTYQMGCRTTGLQLLFLVGVFLLVVGQETNRVLGVDDPDKCTYEQGYRAAASGVCLPQPAPRAAGGV